MWRGDKPKLGLMFNIAVLSSLTGLSFVRIYSCLHWFWWCEIWTFSILILSTFSLKWVNTFSNYEILVPLGVDSNWFLSLCLNYSVQNCEAMLRLAIGVAKLTYSTRARENCKESAEKWTGRLQSVKWLRLHQKWSEKSRIGLTIAWKLLSKV